MVDITSEISNGEEILRFNRGDTTYKAFLGIIRLLDKQKWEGVAVKDLRKAAANTFYEFISPFTKSIGLNVGKSNQNAVSVDKKEVRIFFEGEEILKLSKYSPCVCFRSEDYSDQTILRPKGFLDITSNLIVLEDLVCLLYKERVGASPILTRQKDRIDIVPINYLAKVLAALKTSSEVIGYKTYDELNQIKRALFYTNGDNKVATEILQQEYDKRIGLFSKLIKERIN